MSPIKIRLDQLLTQRGMVPSRQRAQALILAGRVLVAEQKVDKPGASFSDEVLIRILGEDQRYVSRGGIKLEAALAHWSINVQDRACLDIGTSTGGFTDCLLQHGASHVSCVDTGFGQIAMSLRTDPRVHLYERTNARKLAPKSLDPWPLEPKSLDPPALAPKSLDKGSLEAGPTANHPSPPLTLLVMDVSFISATLLLPAVLAAATTLTESVVLVKPQFEAGREHIRKGGIVRDDHAHQLAIMRVKDCLIALGATAIEIIDSPITGMEGNKEFLLHASLAPAHPS